MALHRMTSIARNVPRLFCLALLLAATGCSTHQAAIQSREPLIKENIPSYEPEPPREYRTPEFVPLSEEIVPLKTKIVNIVVRNSTLGDVLHILAEAGGLNLLIDRDVPLDQPVTLSLRNVTAQEALKNIFSSVDCFYSVQGNVLKVESVATRVFELGHPALVNTFTMDVGGDILGGAMITAAGGSSGSSNLKGSITTGSKNDTKAHDFWESLEKSLDALLGKKETQTQAGRTTEARAQTPNAQGGSQAQQTLGTLIDRGSGGAPTTQTVSGSTQTPITINRLTGTIMVTASRKGMERVERYLENVRKVMSRQVMIEARIIEVQLNEGLNFGIDWSFLENVKALGGPVNAGFGALNLATRDFTAATDTAANGSKFQIGLSRANFQSLLTALKTQGDVKTLSNPKVNVMNGHASILTVGRNSSYISKVTSTTTTGTTPVTTFDVQTGSILSGMIIGIVPYISETGEISLNVTPITSDLVRLEEKAVGAAGNQTTISIPTVDLREMTTTVKMQDGQLVIIGGLISKKTSTQDQKIPVLGDIPYLGKLFTRVVNSEQRSELVLLLRPQIVNNEPKEF